MTDFGFSNTILEQILSAVKTKPNIDQVVIFGSRANGSYRPESDIDIAIFGKHLSSAEFSQVWNDIDDLPIIFNIDCIHFDKLTNENLKQKIKTEGVVIFTPTSPSPPP